MKRSEINAEFAWAKALLEKNNIRLPDRAYWTMDEWKARKAEIATIAKTIAAFVGAVVFAKVSVAKCFPWAAGILTVLLACLAYLLALGVFANGKGK